MVFQNAIHPYVDTYNSYEKQHDAFVNHALNTIATLKAQIKSIDEQIEAAEKQKLQAEQMKSLQRDGDEWEATDRTNPASNETDFDNSGSIREKPRSSRWDAAADPSVAATIPPTGPPGLWNDGSMYQPSGTDKIAISNCSKSQIF